MQPGVITHTAALWKAVSRAGQILIPIALVAPVLAGLLGALLPAMGYFPTLGGDRLSLQPAREFIATPGLARAVGICIPPESCAAR